ncbi:MAG: CBS domain-containing protein [Candidatus Omnitrophota bacterium]
MKIKEVMVRDVVSIKPQENAYAAWQILTNMQISGLPVINAEGKLVGMFTEKEILAHMLPSYIENVGKFIYKENPKSTKKKFSEFKSMAVSELMRREVVTTTEDTTLCEVARVMLTQKARRIPVLDKSGAVVGMVARCDVLKALAGESQE